MLLHESESRILLRQARKMACIPCNSTSNKLSLLIHFSDIEVRTDRRPVIQRHDQQTRTVSSHSIGLQPLGYILDDFDTDVTNTLKSFVYE